VADRARSPESCTALWIRLPENALSPRAISRHDFPAMCDDGLRKRPEPTPGMARPS